MLKNGKKRLLGLVEAIPEFIGTVAGISVVGGKWVEHNVRNLLGEKPRLPKQAAKSPFQLEAKKRITAIEEKITKQAAARMKTARKSASLGVKTKKKAVKKKKTVKKPTEIKEKTVKKSTNINKSKEKPAKKPLVKE